MIAGIIYFAGSHDADMAKAMSFLMGVGIISSGPVGITGFIDWIRLPKHTPTWNAGRIHMIVTGVATVMFIVAWQAKEETFQKGVITANSFALILAAYAVMAFGGWLGGKLVFVFGYRVLPAEAAAPGEGRGR